MLGQCDKFGVAQESCAGRSGQFQPPGHSGQLGGPELADLGSVLDELRRATGVEPVIQPPHHVRQASIRQRTPLHEGFLKVYRYVFDVERQAGHNVQLTWELMERGHAVAEDRLDEFLEVLGRCLLTNKRLIHPNPPCCRTSGAG